MSKCSTIWVWNCDYAIGTATNARDMKRSSNYTTGGGSGQRRKKKYPPLSCCTKKKVVEKETKTTTEPSVLQQVIYDLNEAACAYTLSLVFFRFHI